MTKKKKTVEFEEGWADELMEDMDMTQEDIDNLMNGIIQLVTTGEILHDAVRVDDLPEDEQQEIMDMLERKEKRTRH
jgi:Holliday junction resolvase RusA-like endonuclease